MASRGSASIIRSVIQSGLIVAAVPAATDPAASILPASARRFDDQFLAAIAALPDSARFFKLAPPFASSTGTSALLSLIHISEPTRLGMISYAVFCLKKKKNI